MIRSVVAIGLCLFLAACLSPLGLLTGGGPNVAANGQAGATNAQTLGVTDQSAQSVTRSTVGTVRQSRDANQVSAQQVGKVTVNQVSPALLGLVAALSWLVGWETPSRREIRRWIVALVHRPPKR